MADEKDELTKIIADIQGKLDKAQLVAIDTEITRYMSGPEYQNIQDQNEKTRALANRRLVLMLRFMTARQLEDAIPKVLAAQPKVLADLQKSLNDKLRELTYEAAQKGMGAEEKNTLEAVTKWYAHRDTVIGKYLEQATSVQSAMTGFAGLSGIVGMIFQAIPGHEDTGKMLVAKAFEIQTEMARRTAAEMANINRMQEENLPSNAILASVKERNAKLKGIISPDIAPTDDLIEKLPERMRIQPIVRLLSDIRSKENQINGSDVNASRLRGVSSLGGGTGYSTIAAMNPLNLKFVGSDDFRTFSSWQEGWQAAKNDLTGKVTGNSPKMGGKQPTIENLITVWAPPKDNNKPGLMKTADYIAHVAKGSGIPKDQVLTAADVDKIMPHMASVEGGPAVVVALKAAGIIDATTLAAKGKPKGHAAAPKDDGTDVAVLNDPVAKEFYGALMERLGVGTPKGVVTPPFTAVAGLTTSSPTKPDTRAPAVKLPELNYDAG